MTFTEGEGVCAHRGYCRETGEPSLILLPPLRRLSVSLSLLYYPLLWGSLSVLPWLGRDRGLSRQPCYHGLGGTMVALGMKGCDCYLLSSTDVGVDRRLLTEGDACMQYTLGGTAHLMYPLSFLYPPFPIVPGSSPSFSLPLLSGVASGLSPGSVGTPDSWYCWYP